MKTSVDRLFEESKMSLDDLVSKTGLTRQRVEAIITGRWLASPAERERIANAFQVAVDDIDWGHTMAPRNVRYHRFGLSEDF